MRLHIRLGLLFSEGSRSSRRLESGSLSGKILPQPEHVFFVLHFTRGGRYFNRNIGMEFLGSNKEIILSHIFATGNCN